MNYINTPANKATKILSGKIFLKKKYNTHVNEIEINKVNDSFLFN